MSSVGGSSFDKLRTSVVTRRRYRNHSSVTQERRWTVFKKCFAGFALAAVLGWTTSAQDASAVIGNASKAMGVDTLKTVQYSATGLDFALGQASNPDRAVAEVHQQELHTGHQLRDAGLARRSRTRAGRNPAARRRPAADRRRTAAEPDDHRQRRDAVGAAAGNLDDAARLPARPRRRNATVEARTVGGKKYNVVTLRRRQQGQGQRLHQRPEPGRARRDLDRQRVPRRHAVRGHLQRLQGRRRRAVPDAHRPEAGRASDLRSERHRREGQRGREHPAAAGERRRARGGRGASGSGSAVGEAR